MTNYEKDMIYDFDKELKRKNSDAYCKEGRRFKELDQYDTAITYCKKAIETLKGEGPWGKCRLRLTYISSIIFADTVIFSLVIIATAVLHSLIKIFKLEGTLNISLLQIILEYALVTIITIIVVAEIWSCLKKKRGVAKY